MLYYDRIGLLKSSGRTPSGYREYTDRDEERLGQICLYRRTGLSLAEIRRLLGRPRKELAAALEGQLFELSTEIEALRDRQRIIVGLLKKPRLLERAGVMTRETWTELLRASGFTEEDMRRWHRAGFTEVLVTGIDSCRWAGRPPPSRRPRGRPSRASGSLADHRHSISDAQSRRTWMR